MMNFVVLSKIFIVFFVGSVTFWYVLTPYLIQPHPGIVDDVLAKTRLAGDPKAAPKSKVRVENWTKWRLYVNSSSPGVPATQVVYGNSAANVQFSQSAVINMEWRSDYSIWLDAKADGLSVKQEAPSASNEYGIYRHFVASAVEASDGSGAPTVRVVPRFLFGLQYETVDDMYGTDVADFPIIGVFTESPRFDRFIIQAYMNVVTLSVIFLLWANNPPHAIAGKPKAS